MMEFFLEYKDMLFEGTYETLLMTFALSANTAVAIVSS